MIADVVTGSMWRTLSYLRCLGVRVKRKSRLYRPVVVIVASSALIRMISMYTVYALSLKKQSLFWVCVFHESCTRFES